MFALVNVKNILHVCNFFWKMNKIILANIHTQKQKHFRKLDLLIIGYQWGHSS